MGICARQIRHGAGQVDPLVMEPRGFQRIEACAEQSMGRLQMIEVRVQSVGSSKAFHLLWRRKPDFVGGREYRKIKRFSPIASLRQDQKACDLTDQAPQLIIDSSGSDDVANDFIRQTLIDHDMRARRVGTCFPAITVRAMYCRNGVEQGIGACRLH